MQLPVPDIRVRHYFLRADDPDKAAEVQSLVRRLQRMDVEVYRLTAPLAVPDFTPYGRAAAATTLPAGTYWVPMRQAQKHWIQALLNEDTYVPFPYFYDVSGWSNPLLFNVAGGRSGALLAPAAELCRTAGGARRAAAAGRPARRWRCSGPRRARRRASRRVGCAICSSRSGRCRTPPSGRATSRRGARGTSTSCSSRTGTPRSPRTRSARAVAARSRTGSRTAAGTSAGAAARRWRRGSGSPRRRLAAPKSDVAGALLRVRSRAGSPLANGVGPFAWVFYDYDLVMQPSDPAHAAFSYPPAGDGDFFVSGFSRGAEELGGTAAVVDEPLGDGRVVLFASDPNFRAWTVGMQKVLRNAVLGGEPCRRGRGRLGVAAGERGEGGGRAAVARLPDPAHRLGRLGEGAAAVLRARGAAFTVKIAGGKARFLIANPGELSGEEHPYAAFLPDELARAGVEVIAFRVP